MNDNELKHFECAAVDAARAAGRLIHRNLHSAKKVNAETSHDIKLELDVRCQDLIERRLRRSFPRVAFLGEEGASGDSQAEFRWVVDPIDGTVNYAHGIPHASVSIAIQLRKPEARKAKHELQNPYTTVVGVIYDPFTNELWRATRGGPACLNDRPIHVSRIGTLSHTIASIGFAKNRASLDRALPYFLWLARRVRKLRMMGSAALALAYVATGRFDAYIERGISLWDIAAGGLILERAGGCFWHEPIKGPHRFRMIASNRLLRGKFPVPK